MRKFLYILLIAVLVLLAFSSCRKLENDENESVEALQYHVQEVHSLLSKLSEGAEELDEEQVLFLQEISDWMQKVGKQASGFWEKSVAQVKQMLGNGKPKSPEQGPSTTPSK